MHHHLPSSSASTSQKDQQPKSTYTPSHRSTSGHPTSTSSLEARYSSCAYASSSSKTSINYDKLVNQTMPSNISPTPSTSQGYGSDYPERLNFAGMTPHVEGSKEPEVNISNADTSRRPYKKRHDSDTSSLKSSSALPKDSEEYKMKRERNNVAVRKSREKAKRRMRYNETRANELLAENEHLLKQLDVMARMTTGLKTLLNTFGYTPEKINYEVSRYLTQQQQQLHQPSTSRDYSGHSGQPPN